MTRIIAATTPGDIAAAGALFRDYAAFIAEQICLHDFDSEMTRFPEPYTPPNGILLLARGEDLTPAGALGVRPLDEAGACEMKRMYVRPDFRGRGIARALAEAAITWAKGAGYRTMKLDTLPDLTEAVTLYRDLGFAPCAPYNVNPPDRVLFFARDLWD